LVDNGVCVSVGAGDVPSVPLLRDAGWSKIGKKKILSAIRHKGGSVPKEVENQDRCVLEDMAIAARLTPGLVLEYAALYDSAEAKAERKLARHQAAQIRRGQKRKRSQ
jgi:hypothetical protein